MRAKIDINEVEARTKIRAKYLRAIENEEWDLLPGDVYARSFLRTYGDFLGLDTRQLLDDYRRQYDRPSDHELRPITPVGRGGADRNRQSRGGPLIPPWLVVGVVLVGVVVVLYLVGTGNKSKSPPPTTSTVTKAPRHRQHHQGSSRAVVKPKAVKLELVPTGQVYVCLTNGSGKQLIPGQIFDTGQTIPVESGSKLLLTLGNNSVKMKVNGTTIAVSPSSSSIGYELVPGSTKALPTSQQPRCA